MPLAFMAVHLFQLRFGGTPVFGPCSLRPPLYLINIWGVLSLNPFWTNNTAVVSVGVRRGSYRCPFACGRCLSSGERRGSVQAPFRDCPSEAAGAAWPTAPHAGAGSGAATLAVDARATPGAMPSLRAGRRSCAAASAKRQAPPS